MANNVYKFALIAITAAVAWRYLRVSDNRLTALKDEEVKQVDGLKSLVDHSKIFERKEIINVTDGVHVAVGYALANMIMIEGKDGIIIVDTTEKSEIALEIFRDFRKITSKPLRGIVITHFHADHVNGANALLEANPDEDVQVFVHESSPLELDRFIKLADVNYDRASRQFGLYLQKGKELINAGIGYRLEQDRDMLYSTPRWTRVFKDREEFDVAGVKFQLIHTPGETDDQTTVWLPDRKVVFPADNIYEAFPNLYAIRGTTPRSCERWYQSLDKVRALGAAYMVPSHTRPVAGKKEIYDVVTIYRDAIQFVHDQTIRLMNKGYPLDQIIPLVKLPPKLANHPFLQEFYGTVAWSVRGVYDSLIGWFDGEPENLNPLSKSKRGKRWKELMDTKSDGPAVERMFSSARANLEKSRREFVATGFYNVDDLQWALEITSLALETCESSERGRLKALKIDCLRALGSASVSANARNYYLTCAKELQLGLSLRVSVHARKTVLKSLKIEELMSLFPLHFKQETCPEDLVLTVGVKFSDLGKTFYYTIRNRIVEFLTNPETPPESVQASLVITDKVWRQLVIGERGVMAAYASGELTLDGSVMALKNFFDYLERGY